MGFHSQWDVTNKIRRDNSRNNKERIEKGKDENEIWKIVNKMTKPKKDTEKVDLIIDKEKEIVEIINKILCWKDREAQNNLDKKVSCSYVEN